MDFHDLRFWQIGAHFRQNWHERLPERIELGLGAPNIEYLKIAASPNDTWNVRPFGLPAPADARRSKTCSYVAVLIPVLAK